MRKILPFFMSTLLVIFVASYWVLNYTGNNADLVDGKNLRYYGRKRHDGGRYCQYAAQAETY